MAKLSNSQLLRKKIDLVLGELVAVTQDFTNHPQVAKLYPEYLFTLHTMIRASIPQMEMALTASKAREADDAVARGLVRYYSQHIKEEMHHDDWLLDDMAFLGMERSQILQRIPSPIVAALEGAQYYWILHYHPVAMLGLIAVLEGYPPTREFVENLQQKTGYPAEAFRTLAKHGYLDPYHRDDLNEFLDTLHLEPAHEKLISINAMQTVDLTTQAFREMLTRT